MNIITWFTRKITGRHEALTKVQAERIKRLPKDQARREVGAVLFELAVRHATVFVKDGFRSSEPPFKEVPPETVFHEILAMTFWIMDNEMAEGKKTLVPELHDHYFRSYSLPGVTPEERRKANRGEVPSVRRRVGRPHGPPGRVRSLRCPEHLRGRGERPDAGAHLLDH